MEVVAPTVIAFSAKAGENWQELPLELPAATTTVTPACVAALTAVVYPLSLPEPPKLMLRTAGLLPEVVIQSMAVNCHERAPEPSSPSVFTAWRVASLATPKVRPAALPAQCVPWPWRSWAQFLLP